MCIEMKRGRTPILGLALGCFLLLSIGGCASYPRTKLDVVMLQIGDKGLAIGDFDLSKEEFRLATAAFQAGDRTKARDILLPLAEQGDAGAQYNLVLAAREHQTNEEDVSAEIGWFGKAANLGHARAQYSFGLMHLFGLGGLKKDEKEAAKWMLASAEQGYHFAQFLLGFMYDTGWGVPESKDRAEVFKLMRRAAATGNIDAQCFLGMPRACDHSPFYSGLQELRRGM